MADDAGALLVRSGLVSSNALDDARARVASLGGTLGEQLVTSGAITDDELTEFYRSRLLVPQVNPNTLARLTPKVVAAIPGDMAIELRVIPVSLDRDNNLTVAMSDPSDRHAVDEIAFFTGAYIVRAVATQMQIAWCLAHYYGHVTALGQRLLRASESSMPIQPALSAVAIRPRTKGQTSKVNATRHRAIAPVTASAAGSAEAKPAGASGSAGAKPVGAAGSAKGAAGSGGVVTAKLTSPPSTRTAAVATSAPAARRTGPVPVAGSAGASATAPSTTAGPVTARRVSPPTAAGSASAAASASPPGAGAAGTANTAPTSMPEGVTGGASSEPTGSGPPPARPGVPPPSGAPQGPASRAGATSAPEPAAGGTDVAPGASPPPQAPSPPPAARSSSPPAPSAPAGADRAPGPGAGPAAPMMVPGVFPGVDDGLPKPMLDDALPAPALDDALPMPVLDDESSARMSISPDVLVDGDDDPEVLRERTLSGEIREAVQRAPSGKPPLPDPGEDDGEPLITIERGENDAARPRLAPPRRRAVKSDPPELYARAGEVDLRTGADRAIDLDEPRIVIDEDALARPTGGSAGREAAAPPGAVIDVADDADTGAVIRDRLGDLESQPILLDRLRPSSEPRRSAAEPAAPASAAAHDGRPEGDDDTDTGRIDVVVLDAPKRSRPERRTRLGIPPAPVNARQHHDAQATGVPAILDHHDADRTTEVIVDPTAVDLRAAPPGDDTASDQLAAPPAPDSDLDTNPRLIAPPPAAARPASIGPRPAARPAARIDGGGGDDDDDDDDDDDAPGSHTAEMTAVELDDAIPQRTSAILPELLRRQVEYDPVDDGWGPPGTTIPPPLLGAIPGSDDDDEHPGAIPMPDVDSSPLLVTPPSPGEPEGKSLIRALEEATARAIEVIRQLERTRTRDEIVDLMISYLAETHHRAGFFATRHPTPKAPGELGLFVMTPRPAAMPSVTLRLDRSSTLQDVVDTRLPYRGPMHDDASRSFLISILGACPPEILLVPVAVRERVVGVLFGEHRLRHTFDDQLALAARAAGMAFERVLRSRRG